MVFCCCKKFGEFGSQEVFELSSYQPAKRRRSKTPLRKSVQHNELIHNKRATIIDEPVRSRELSAKEKKAVDTMLDEINFDGKFDDMMKQIETDYF